MVKASDPGLHDAYAADYDQQVQGYNCHVADVLFGLCYEFIRPGQKLLDAGIGSGLSSRLFAKAGLEISGMDFSPVMLDICRAKGFVSDLTLHDMQQVPWHYPSGSFDHLICCGVMHFIPDLDGIIAEGARVLGGGGYFAFTARVSPHHITNQQRYTRQNIDGFEIFSHASDYLKSLMEEFGFQPLKVQNCFAGEDIFSLWVVRKR
jgi:predicted TPR repeat methyltransferase